MDAGDAEDFAAALAALPADFRGIDLLVNNAGLAQGTLPAQRALLSDWRTMIDTNITALVTLTHRLLPQLVERKGAIINISSVAGVYPYPGGNAYGGTKAFVSQFSLGLRSDLHGSEAGPHGVLNIRSERLIRQVLSGGEVGFGEAYLDGHWDSPDLARLLQ